MNTAQVWVALAIAFLAVLAVLGYVVTLGVPHLYDWWMHRQRYLAHLKSYPKSRKYAGRVWSRTR